MLASAPVADPPAGPSGDLSLKLAGRRRRYDRMVQHGACLETQRIDARNRSIYDPELRVHTETEARWRGSQHIRRQEGDESQ